jgi:hypothetical protein
MPLLESSAGLKDKIISAASQTATVTNVELSHSNIVPIITPRQRTWKLQNDQKFGTRLIGNFGGGFIGYFGG